MCTSGLGHTVTHVTSLNFGKWKCSQTVQDRHAHAIEDWYKIVCGYLMTLLRVTFSGHGVLEALKVDYFCRLKPLCPSAMHDSSRPCRCAGWIIRGVSSTTLVAIDIGWSQLRSSWHQHDWLYVSLMITRTTLHAVR